jgi:chromosome segregation and condensation protein ScpB
LLIDAIVQQTTVLIAQLSTAAGLRSPLAHVADQVFLSLAQEIERQGVSRQVVADMFGIALRTYQRKVQRLEESVTAGGQSLWEAILGYIAERGPVRRAEVIERFRRDEETAVTAVLADLVASGLVYSSGRGESMVYGVTSEADRRALSNDDAVEALAILVWGTVFRSPGLSTHDVVARTRADEGVTRQALKHLLADGRVLRDADTDESPLRSAAYVIRAGDEKGWEAAVFDHFQAVASAIASKVELRGTGSEDAELVGGTTLHFGVHPEHPYAERVLGTVKRIRAELDAFWREVAEYNLAHPFDSDTATRVTFYFGQSLRRPAESARRADDGKSDPQEAEKR